MIYYIHGFNSLSTGNEKIDLLEKLLNKSIKPLDYVSGDTFENNFKLLISKIKDKNPIFIGTSLGGFFAAMLARHMNGTAIMVNPAIDPKNTLLNYIGPQKNFKTGEKYFFKKDIPNSYPDILIPKKSLLLLDKGDEIINYKKTYESIGGLCSEKIIFEGGNHRFQHWKESKGFLIKYI